MESDGLCDGYCSEELEWHATTPHDVKPGSDIPKSPSVDPDLHKESPLEVPLVSSVEKTTPQMVASQQPTSEAGSKTALPPALGDSMPGSKVSEENSFEMGSNTASPQGVGSGSTTQSTLAAMEKPGSMSNKGTPAEALLDDAPSK